MPENTDLEGTTHRAPKPTFLTQTHFKSFSLPVEILNGLKSAGFTYCTPIQAQTLSSSLSGRDVAGQAQTGTGKTAAFLITIFARLVQSLPPKPKLPSALIVAPTRELAFQIHAEARVLGKHTRLRAVQIVGGVDYKKQADQLRRGVDIIIGTPGRLIDFIKQRIFNTNGIQVVVIDEADRLLDLGFAKDMRYILSRLPAFDKRQSMLFSATLSYRVLELTYEYMNLPEFISVTPEEVTVERIDQSLFHVGLDNKLRLLLGLLRHQQWKRVLIFINTKAGAEWLTLKLKGNGWPAEGITGDLQQRKRFQLMAQFKSGKIKILVATDVASRGIHVEDISHVVNYDLPQDAENYVHRIGRTARAGKTGIAISLACEQYVYHLEAIEDWLGYKIPVVWPEDNWLEDDTCGPICMATKGRKGKAARGRGRTKKRLARLRKPEKKWKQSYPGAFFGFPPERKDGTQATPQPQSDGKPRTSRGRRKRGPRKKSAQIQKR